MRVCLWFHFLPPLDYICVYVATLGMPCLHLGHRSVSIACWVVVFSPQIIENFRRSSAEGLSLQFIVIWLLGDVFNILVNYAVSSILCVVVIWLTTQNRGPSSKASCPPW